MSRKVAILVSVSVALLFGMSIWKNVQIANEIEAMPSYTIQSVDKTMLSYTIKVQTNNGQFSVKKKLSKYSLRNNRLLKKGAKIWILKDRLVIKSSYGSVISFFFDS